MSDVNCDECGWLTEENNLTDGICSGCDESFRTDDYSSEIAFADPGGRSSLRAESEDNPRDQDCPTCGDKAVLTRLDRQLGYQCNSCADLAEGY